MNLVCKNLTIRNAESSDAEQLCTWWNDGSVMAHAGFPLGLGETPERIAEILSSDSDKTTRRHIIEADGIPIGEMNYRKVGDAKAEIGIKICDEDAQNKGYGTTLLAIFIDALFSYYGYEKIILDTNTQNTRAQHVYTKLGFTSLGINPNSWRDQLGEVQSSIDYEMSKASWQERQKQLSSNTVASHASTVPLYYRIREEEPRDYRIVEELTREAFWVNTDAKERICEHLLTHKLRLSTSFIPQLDFVAECQNEIVGHIIYSMAKTVSKDGHEHPLLTFGPLSVLPRWQNRGVGGALMSFSIAAARRLGYGAIVFFGHPEYYPRFGFNEAGSYGITTKEGKVFPAFMAMELVENALEEVTGYFAEDPLFEELEKDADAVDAFDATFPPKAPLPYAGMELLLERLSPDARKTIASLGLEHLRDMRGQTEVNIAKMPGIDTQALETIRQVMHEHGRIWGGWPRQ